MDRTAVRHSRGGHEDVDSAELQGSAGGHRLLGALVADVDDLELRALGGRSNALPVLGFDQVAAHHGRALCCETQRAREPDARCRTRHNRDLAFQTTHFSLPAA